jgi:hypothetical protein
MDGVPHVHPVLFVHRVEGLDAGIYCLARDPDALTALQAEMRPDWLWARVPRAPQYLPLYLLMPLDAREFAATVSCHQRIAADSAFSLAMLARFDDITRERPWLYRHRFWEAGVLGHVLYLEAEAAGVQGTGIGCYFDDGVHQALGLATRRFQDLYHFTVGTARVDARLVSEPAYAHLTDRPSRGLPSPSPVGGEAAACGVASEPVKLSPQRRGVRRDASINQSPTIRSLRLCASAVNCFT